MDTKKRLLTLAAALFISLTACEGLPTEPTFGLETGEAALSLAALTGTHFTIDFEDIKSTGSRSTVLSTYNSDYGFTLVNSTKPEDGLISPEDDNVANVGSTTLIPLLLLVDHAPPLNGVTLLTKDGEEALEAFDVLSIDIGQVPFVEVPLGGPVSPVTVTFTGTKFGGTGLVFEYFTTNGVFDLETLTFSDDFTNLESLSWVQTVGFFYQFDNIVLSFLHSSGSQDDPVTRDDCKKGGWDNDNFDGRFRNQGECVRFVEKNKNGKDKPQERPARES